MDWRGFWEDVQMEIHLPTAPPRSTVSWFVSTDETALDVRWRTERALMRCCSTSNFFCGARCFFAHTHTRTLTQISTQSPHCGQTHVVIFVLSTHSWGLCNVPSNSRTYLLSYMLSHCACKSLSNAKQDDCVCLSPFTRYQPCCLGHV